MLRIRKRQLNDKSSFGGLSDTSQASDGNLFDIVSLVLLPTHNTLLLELSIIATTIPRARSIEGRLGSIRTTFTKIEKHHPPGLEGRGG